jgi:cell division transport system ATP-binding protein
MIEFIGVLKRYPGSRDVLKNVSFAVQPAEFVYLTGHSGAGKSTVMRLIAAIERPTAGTVLVHHQNVGRLPERSMPFLRRQLGMVLQDHRLLFDRSVFDNVMLPLQIAGMDRREARRRVRAALDKVGLLGREKSYPITLSGGEQQRVCLARAVVNRPALLIADEPTAGLDVGYADEILGIFRDFHRVGVTVLVATHDESLIARFPGRMFRLDHGNLAA